MVIRAFKKIVSIRSVLAFGLMFWCAGTGCMMATYARAAATELNDAAVVMDHAMAGSMSVDAHACCKARRPSVKGHQARPESKSESAELNLLTLPSTPSPTGVMDCCPLTTGSIVVTSRSQSNDRATVRHHADPASLLLIPSDPAPLAVPLRLPNRAHSYLLDCAFLI